MNISDIRNVAKLRWTLQISTMKKSVLQACVFVAECILAVLVIVWAWGASFGMTSEMANDTASLHMFVAYSGMVWTGIVLFAGFAQIVAFGNGSLNARQLYLMGLKRKSLRNSLIVSQACTLTGLTGFIALTGVLGVFSSHFAQGIGMVILTWIFAIICAALSVLLASALAQAVAMLAMVIIRSKKARSAAMAIFVIAIIVLSQLPSIIAALNSRYEYVESDDSDGYRYSTYISMVLSDEQAALMSAIAPYIPFAGMLSVPVRIVRMDIANVGNIAISIVVYAVFLALFVWGFDWALKRDIVAGPQLADQTTTKMHGLGIFGLGFVHDRYTGIIARILTSWTRDFRYGIQLVIPLLFVVIYGFQGMANQRMSLMVLSIPLSGFLMAMVGINNLAYDGTPLIMHSLSGVLGRIDWYARSTVQVGVGIIMQVLISVIIVAIPGAVTSWELFAGLEATGVIFLLTGAGLAPVLSSLIMCPVQSANEPFKRPQGGSVAQVVVPFAFMGLYVALIVPGAIAGVIAYGAGADVVRMFTIALGFQLVCAIGYFIGGNEWGGHILDKRRLKIHATLRNFAQLMH